MISSRTPEGSPNRCAVCGHEIRMEPSMPGRDAPCPHCGSLLWFAPNDGAELFSSDESPHAAPSEALLQSIAEQLNVPVDSLRQDRKLLAKLAAADSLDVVDLVMELEHEGR